MRSEQSAPGQRRASDHRQQQHIIRYGNGRAGRKRGHERRPDEEADRVRTEPQNLGSGSEKEMGCTLDHLPGHTITLRRGPPHAPSLGVGIGRSRLGAALQDRKMLPVERWALSACVRCAANHALRTRAIRRCERSTLYGSSLSGG